MILCVRHIDVTEGILARSPPRPEDCRGGGCDAADKDRHDVTAQTQAPRRRAERGDDKRDVLPGPRVETTSECLRTTHHGGVN